MSAVAPQLPSIFNLARRSNEILEAFNDPRHSGNDPSTARMTKLLAESLRDLVPSCDIA
jgi:hypothetical protein